MSLSPASRLPAVAQAELRGPLVAWLRQDGERTSPRADGALRTGLGSGLALPQGVPVTAGHALWPVLLRAGRERVAPSARGLTAPGPRGGGKPLRLPHTRAPESEQGRGPPQLGPTPWGTPVCVTAPVTGSPTLSVHLPVCPGGVPWA